MASVKQDIETLIAEASQHPFSGWDFSFIRERMRESALPWDYGLKVRAAFASAQILLDMGTGGGEYLASLVPLPPQTFATEAYAPNIPAATARLEPLGVRVVPVESEDQLPFSDNFFDLVINRHETYSAEKTIRILKRGGWFITQQVGERNLIELNRWLQGETKDLPSDYQRALASLRRVGFEVVESHEAFTETVFCDVGAVVYYLKAVPWQVPDFSVEKYRTQLSAIHNHIQAAGGLTAAAHRFYIEARKP
jgi:SAM-dependent methyltransferase